MQVFEYQFQTEKTPVVKTVTVDCLRVFTHVLSSRRRGGAGVVWLPPPPPTPRSLRSARLAVV